MIEIKCGTCGTSQGYKTASDGPLSLPAAEERRLVSRGVAAYVTRPVMGPAAVNVPCEETAVNVTCENETSGEADLDEDCAVLREDETDEDGVLDVVDGHFTVESLMRMTRAGMEQLAGELGVNVSRCRNKNDIAGLLAEVEVQADEDDDTPPELNVDPLADTGNSVQ